MFRKLSVALLACLFATAAFGQTTRPAIGINVDGVSESECAAWFSDLAHYFNKWESVAPGGPSPDASQLSADGYPLIAAKSVCGLHGYPDGKYALSYTGGGSAAFDGSLTLDAPAVKGPDGVWRATVTKHGDGVGLIVSPANFDTIHNLSLLRPGAVAGQIWDASAVKLLQNFAVLRCMDLGRTNNSQLVEWKDRRHTGDFPWSGAPGIPYEAISDLAVQTGRPIWICIPSLANDDFVRQLAKLFHARYPTGLPLYVEYSNELWNTAFSQFHDVYNGPAFTSTLPDLPASETGKTGGFTRTATWIGARAYQCSQIFDQEWGADSARVKFVYGGRCQSPDGAWWNEQGLYYVKTHYGEPSKFFRGGLAVAPYFGLSKNDALPIPNLDALFVALNANFDTQVIPWVKGNKALADKYGLSFVSYEGGQSLFSGGQNNALKALSQNDARMGVLYHRWAKVCRDGGLSLVNHLSVSGASPWWPLLAPGQHTSVKYEAVMAEQAVLPAPWFSAGPTTLPTPTTLPATVPATQPDKPTYPVTVTVTLDGKVYEIKVSPVTQPNH